MSKTITLKELLDFLAKAHKVSSGLRVIDMEQKGEYAIGIYCDWHDDGNFHIQTTSITEEGKSNSKSSNYDFFTMNNLLDEVIKKKEEREVKKQKRRELISRLTDEEKELLGVR